MGGTHQIIQIKGHYELYDDNGNFVSSGDTWDECYNDLLEMLTTKAKENIKVVMEAIAV